jgi:hypothetical protein
MASEPASTSPPSPTRRRSASSPAATTPGVPQGLSRRAGRALPDSSGELVTTAARWSAATPASTASPSASARVSASPAQPPLRPRHPPRLAPGHRRRGRRADLPRPPRQPPQLDLHPRPHRRPIRVQHQGPPPPRARHGPRSPAPGDDLVAPLFDESGVVGLPNRMWKKASF